MSNLKPAIVGVLIIAGFGVGFGGGYFFRNYQLTKLRGNFTQGGLNMMGGANGNFQRFNGTRGTGQNGMFRGGATQGEILSIDDKSFTVKMSDGSSKIVLLSESTKYTNTTVSSKNDLKAGINVAVFGTPNSDGSLTAVSVQFNPVDFRTTVSPVPTNK